MSPATAAVQPNRQPIRAPHPLRPRGTRRTRPGRTRRLAVAGLGAALALATLPALPAMLPPPSARGAGDAAPATASWSEHAAPVPEAPPLPAPSGPVSPARKYFSDVELVDQDGQKHRFYSDLLAGRTVVVDAFYTSCNGACPVMEQKLATLQDWLGDRLGKEAYLLSITVDPQVDTPARLKEYSQRLGARPGWFFLTGKKENVDWALYKLGYFVEQKEAHSNLLIMGKESTGLWKKVFGLATSDDIIHSLDAVLHDAG